MLTTKLNTSYVLYSLEKIFFSFFPLLELFTITIEYIQLYLQLFLPSLLFLSSSSFFTNTQPTDTKQLLTIPVKIQDYFLIIESSLLTNISLKGNEFQKGCTMKYF